MGDKGDRPVVDENEKRARLALLKKTLGTLPDDFTNGALDTVLGRYLAARGWDVDKAREVQLTILCCLLELNLGRD